MKTKKNKNAPRRFLQSTFWRVYLALLIVAVICLGVGLSVLNDTLKDYEASQPIYAAEEAARLFEQANYASIYDLDTARDSIGDKALYVESLTKLAAGKTVTWKAAWSANDNERVYNVCLDGDRVASFTLVPSEEPTPKGNRSWVLGSVTTMVSLATPEPVITPVPTPAPTPEPQVFTCHITAPSDYMVRVDGKLLTRENAVQTTPIKPVQDGLLPSNLGLPTLTEYEYTTDNSAPVVTVALFGGAEQTLAPSDDLTWSCGFFPDEALQSEVGDAAFEVAKKLAAYSTDDGPKKAILRCCATDSPARATVNEMHVTQALKHKNVTYENVSYSNFIRYTENCFSCHFEFDYVGNKGTKVERVYSTIYTMYFIREGDSFKLYSFTFY